MRLNDDLKRLERELAEAHARIAELQIEVDAHEGLLKLSMEDMHRIYDDLLLTHVRLLQADKMATIGILTAGIVHEIKNPLSYVQGNVWLLNEALKGVERLPSQPDMDLQSVLGGAREGVDRMAKIVQDIRMFSRTDKGDFIPVNINEVLDSVTSIVGPSLKTADLKKEYGDVPKIKGSPQQLGQVFLNFIINASQAMELEGGKKGLITLRTRVTAGGVEVDVRDDGKGMTPETLAKLFEPFFTTKGPEEGTGLGLSVSRDIITRHGGEIRVASSPGAGSTFTVLFPVA